MESGKRKPYQNHKVISKNEIYDKIDIKNLSTDRYYMVQMLKPNIEYLEYHLNSIDKCQNFIEIFKKYGFRTDHVKIFIKGFQSFLKNSIPLQNRGGIDLIRERDLKKANFAEKNILINRFSYEYPNQTIQYVQNFIVNDYMTIKDQQKFVQEFIFKIKKLFQNAKDNGNNHNNLGKTLQINKI